MKKVIFLILLLCIISFMCFGQWSIELFGGIPLTWEEGNLLGYKALTHMSSISFGFGLVYPINDSMSFCVYDEVIFPQKFETTIGGVTTSVNRDAYDTLMGMSVLIGPVFNLYADPQKKFNVSLTSGIRWMWLIASSNITMVIGSNFGLGAGAGAQYNVSEKIYIFGRLMLYYDFFAFTSTTIGSNTISDSGLISSFGFTPNIGVGIRF